MSVGKKTRLFNSLGKTAASVAPIRETRGSVEENAEYSISLSDLSDKRSFGFVDVPDRP